MGCGSGASILQEEVFPEPVADDQKLIDQLFAPQHSQLFNMAQQAGNFYEMAEKKKGFDWHNSKQAYITLEDLVDSISKDFGYVDAIFIFYVYYLIFQPIQFNHQTSKVLKYLSLNSETIHITLQQFLRIGFICAPNQIKVVIRNHSPLFLYFYAADQFYSGYANVEVLHSLLRKKFKCAQLPVYPNNYINHSEIQTRGYEQLFPVFNRISLSIGVNSNRVKKFSKKIKKVKNEVRMEIDTFITIFYSQTDLGKINASNGMMYDLEMKAMDGELSLDD